MRLRSRPQAHASLPGMTDSQQFRADGHAAIDWAADYLEGVRELPVMSTAEPGEIRAQLPSAPPDQAEPFADVLADLDRVLLPGITHWNHPRFFAYFSITGSQPGILAELLTATLNANGMLWRTSPAVTELEQLTLSWMCQLLGLPESWHGHIEDSASTSTLAALCAARSARPDRRVVVASEHAHSSIDRACRILGLELRHVPVDDAFRMRVAGARPERRLRGGRRRRHHVDDVGRLRAGDRRCGRRGGRLAAHRRGLQRLGARLPRAAHAGVRASRLGRRESPQVAVHADRLLLPLQLAARRPARGVRAHARVPAHVGGGRPQPQRVRAVARPSLPRPQAVGGTALLRPQRAAVTDPRARASRRAVRGLGARRAGMGAVRAPAVLRRLLPARGRRRPQRGAARGRQRERRGLPLAHASGRPPRAAPRDRQRGDDRGRRARRLGAAQARGRPPPARSRRRAPDARPRAAAHRL